IAQIVAAHRDPPHLDDVPSPWRRLAKQLLQMTPAHRPSSEALAALLVDVSLDSLADPALLHRVRNPQPSEAVDLTMPTEQAVDIQIIASTLSSDLGPAHNLPLQRNGFIGRRQEIDALQQMISANRQLITLLGPGGMGKSRLAQELGRILTESAQAWPGGIWFVPLAEAQTLDDILGAVAAVLQVQLGRNPKEQLGHALHGRGRMLLILDNFEQVTDLAPETVGSWMDRTQETTFLVTSRHPLLLKGEHRLHVQPLDAEDAIRLFVERVRMIRTDLALDDADRDAVRALVALLDRMPLAIELAAARAMLLTPQSLLSRMSRRFDVLKSRSTERPARQRTLQATIAWSWEMLDAMEQAALAQCSVFEGSFSVDAAEAVIDLSGFDEPPWVDDVLASLVDKSLLVSGQDGRLSMLLSIQAFAADRLTERGAAERRHYRHFESLTPAHGRTLSSAERQRLRDELDNLVTASHRATEQQAAAPAFRCALTAAWLYQNQGPYSAGLEVLHRVHAAFHQTLDLPQQSRLHETISALYESIGRLESAERHVRTALQFAQQSGEPISIGITLTRLAAILRLLNQPERAEEHFNASLEIARAQGSQHLIGDNLGGLGLLYLQMGRLQEAEQLLHESYALFQRLNVRDPACRSLTNLGLLYRRQGRNTLAEQYYSRGLAMAKALKDRALEGPLLLNMSALAVNTGNLERARQLLSRCLLIARAQGNQLIAASSLANLGVLSRDMGRLDVAEKHLMHALQLERAFQNRIGEGVVLANLTTLYQQKRLLAEAERHSEMALEAARETQNRRLASYVLGCRAEIRIRRGALDEARPLLEEALALTRSVADRNIEGQLLSIRAELQSSVRDLDAALTDATRAEALLRASNDRLWLGRVLCQRARWEAQRDPEGAARALSEARAIAAATGVESGAALMAFIHDAAAIVGA
ncbi:MAG: tetratricopeptide repeat protein, partial [Myxococcota bacterium]